MALSLAEWSAEISFTSPQSFWSLSTEALQNLSTSLSIYRWHKATLRNHQQSSFSMCLHTCYYSISHYTWLHHPYGPPRGVLELCNAWVSEKMPRICWPYLSALHCVSPQTEKREEVEREKEREREEWESGRGGGREWIGELVSVRAVFSSPLPSGSSTSPLKTDPYSRASDQLHSAQFLYKGVMGWSAD